jgi:exopolyphosphatase / guanosine-5'-triphosphate,3'-diphosphate pyrophosphatase
MRTIAVIDMGTNTFNLLIVREVKETIKFVYSTKEGVALGMGGVNENRITKDAWGRGLSCIEKFTKVCSEYNCQSIVAFGTSAIRGAVNGIDFVAEIEQRFPVSCKIIDGNEEAQLIYNGVCMTHVFNEQGVIMDIGGGSTEFILADKNGILKKESFDIGISRIFQQFQFSDPFSPEDCKKIELYLEERAHSFFNNLQVDELIGSSGTFETFYEIIHDKPFPEGYVQLEMLRNEIDEVIERIIKMTKNDRDNNDRIIPIRRIMLPIAAVKIRWVMRKLKTKRLIITPCSLKEGVAFNLIRNSK